MQATPVVWAGARFDNAPRRALAGGEKRGKGMKVLFPSEEFFEALKIRMAEQRARFEKLGYFDATLGVRVLEKDGTRREYLLAFDVYDCTEVRGVDDLVGEDPDFILEATVERWQEMLRNIQENGAADAEHGINTLTHFGDSMRVIYDDPERHDKLFRFSESIQGFFDLAAGVEIEYAT